MRFSSSNRPDPKPGRPGKGPTEPMPMELRLDLLVDGELPEEERRAFLRELDAAGTGEACWRDLAIRFLQQQTEKQTARHLMAGGRLIPMSTLARERFWHRAFGWRTVTAAAAGLLIVASTALVIVDVYPGGHPAMQETAKYNVVLPAETVGDPGGGTVMVPLVKGANGNDVFFSRGPADDGRTIKRTWIIDPVQGGAVTIPVDTLRAKYN